MKAIFIHHTAEVAPGVSIGNGTKIWNNAQVREKASIGDNCVIGKGVYVDTGVSIGSGVKIQNGVSVFHGVSIEDDVFVGPEVSFTNDRVPRAFNSDWTVTETMVEKGASIGANATIRCGVKIGRYAMIGAGSVVTKNVPAHALVMGNPAVLVGRVCICGHRLNNEFICESCNKKFEEGAFGD